MNRGLNCEDAMDCKEMARDINKFYTKAWSEATEEVCYEGIKQKFVQYPYLLEALRKTSNKTVMKSSNDDVWGTGVPL